MLLQVLQTRPITPWNISIPKHIVISEYHVYHEDTFRFLNE